MLKTAQVTKTSPYLAIQDAAVRGQPVYNSGIKILRNLTSELTGIMNEMLRKYSRRSKQEMFSCVGATLASVCARRFVSKRLASERRQLVFRHSSTLSA